MSYEHGRILAVNEVRLGSELVADHAAGVTSLTVEDPVDFDEDGGWLKVGDEVIEYTTFDDDTGEITMKTALGAAASGGDRVWLWDELRQVVTTDKIAQVELDGDDDNTDPLEATVPLQFLNDLEEGIRGARGESVLLEQDGDEWRIVDVLGLAAPGASGLLFKHEDPITVTTGGVQQVQLTYVPVADSLILAVNGLKKIKTAYAVAGRSLTTDASPVATDVLDIQYAYHAGSVEVSAVENGPRLNSPWLVLELDETGGTTATDSSGNNLHATHTNVTVGKPSLLASGDGRASGYSAASASNTQAPSSPVMNGSAATRSDVAIMARIKPTTASLSGHRLIVSRWGTATNYRHFTAGILNGRLYLSVHADQVTVTGSTPLVAGQTYTVGYLYDPAQTGMWLFLDGKEDGFQSTTGYGDGGFQSAEALMVGSTSASTAFDGDVDRVECAHGVDNRASSFLY